MHATTFAPETILTPKIICIPLGVLINYKDTDLIPILIAASPETFTEANLGTLFTRLIPDYNSVLNKFKRGEIASAEFYTGIAEEFKAITGQDFPLNSRAFSIAFNAPLKRNDANIVELTRLIESGALSQIAFISYSNPENLGKILRGDFNARGFAIEAIDDGAVQVSIARISCPLYVTHLLKDTLKAGGPGISEHDRLIAHVRTCNAEAQVIYCKSMDELRKSVASQSAASLFETAAPSL
jgi:hypothetical protein